MGACGRTGGSAAVAAGGWNWSFKPMNCRSAALNRCRLGSVVSKQHLGER